MSAALDARWMAIALEAGRAGSPRPNPHVGAAVVVGGQVIATGWHDRAGGPHAEIVALRAAGERARGGTLYVTLEPCNHFGRTPPCVDAVLESGVSRVVIGRRDPNPHVAGGGAERLARAGVEVVVGCLEREATALVATWLAQVGT
jgi:diaminohydroxyphosphoribosylaminopyrimidine deaminase/5-amino-6-(5-phosphoribosylamino)uracil reductase